MIFHSLLYTAVSMYTRSPSTDTLHREPSSPTLLFKTFLDDQPLSLKVIDTDVCRSHESEKSMSPSRTAQDEILIEFGKQLWSLLNENKAGEGSATAETCFSFINTSSIHDVLCMALAAIFDDNMVRYDRNAKSKTIRTDSAETSTLPVPSPTSRIDRQWELQQEVWIMLFRDATGRNMFLQQLDIRRGAHEGLMTEHGFDAMTRALRVNLMHMYNL